MAKKPETLFKERIVPQLNSIPKSWWFKTQMLSLLGIPDIIGCVNGRFVAIELKKSAKDKPSALQQYVLKTIRKAGGYAKSASPENWKKIKREIENLGQSVAR